MAGASRDETPAMRGPTPEIVDQQTLALHVETAAIDRHVRRTLVRATRLNTERDESVSGELHHEHVVVERVAVGRVVDAVPPVRQEGDVTIMPVVEEELVVVRRLVLKEEVHLRRVRTVTTHAETVPVRQQHVEVTRAKLDDPTNPRSEIMSDETFVAMFETEEQGRAAVADLKRAGIPDADITLQAGSHASDRPATVPAREPGFWSSLFGGEPGHDTAVYDRGLEGGDTVVMVKASRDYGDQVLEILDAHEPIDIDERASGYALPSTAPASAAGAVNPTAAKPAFATSPIPAATGTPARAAHSDDTLQLSEENLSVDKRVVNRGGTRIRRFVVEAPVEQRVTLHEEKVTLDRRPVTDARPVTDGAFTEKTIEMMETAEEAVVSKTARVYEEVGLRKEASERVETVRDTVRKEQVEVEQVPGTTVKTTTDGKIQPTV